MSVKLERVGIETKTELVERVAAAESLRMWTQTRFL